MRMRTDLRTKQFMSMRTDEKKTSPEDDAIHEDGPEDEAIHEHEDPKKTSPEDDAIHEDGPK
jgi:hypothetical protein